ncbi:MAG: TIGR02281 family clan AA aspartic protease [Rhodobacteraceae bacterium]|nr:TIGR02281 family clan AA aspartic protease [Paracoccaceae bacterium]
MDGDSAGRLIYLMLLLVAVGGWVMVEYRQRMGLALRTAMAWGLIFLGVAAGYGLWQDLRHDLLPRQMVTETGELVIPRAADGHYYIDIDVDGTRLTMMADTGATSVVLSPADARRLGIAPESLIYTGQAMTANGTVRTARTTLQNVTLGPFTEKALPVWVNEAEMDVSLLGMDLLGRYRIEIDRERMILRP